MALVNARRDESACTTRIFGFLRKTVYAQEGAQMRRKTTQQMQQLFSERHMFFGKVRVPEKTCLRHLFGVAALFYWECNAHAVLSACGGICQFFAARSGEVGKRVIGGNGQSCL